MMNIEMLVLIIFINLDNFIKRENLVYKSFNRRICSDIPKDEGCFCFPACNPAFLPPRLVILAY